MAVWFNVDNNGLNIQLGIQIKPGLYLNLITQDKTTYTHSHTHIHILTPLPISLLGPLEEDQV